MSTRSIDKRMLVRQLLELGVKPGSILVVHTAFSRVKPVESGPLGLISALLKALGRKGTLIMPSMSSDDEQVFDANSSSCADMGIVADRFWRIPEVLRSNNPHAFAALGPHAKRITAPHPIDPPHGLDSPIGRAYEMDAQILLLGVGHEANTMIHFAENLAEVRYRRDKYVTIRKDDKALRYEYREIDHCCQKFSLVDEWLDQEQLQRKAIVGHAQARLCNAVDVVTMVVDRLKENETLFLHSPGVDKECDDAWQSMMAESDTM